jgi:RNA polymerase sigma-54 factor
MKQSLQLKLGQSLTMTPQLQQAIRLLQLSTLDLQNEIQEALDSNPMLEVGDDASSTPEESNLDNSQSEAKTNNDASPDANSEPSNATANDSASDANTEPTQAQTDENQTDSEWSDEIPTDLPVDTSWDDVYQSSAPAGPAPSDDDDNNFESRRGGTESLQDHLLWQLNLTPFSDRDYLIALTIIDDVQPSGLLTSPLQNIYEGLSLQVDELELDEMSAVLHRLQQFDPPGVAGENLGDCLHIQLNQLNQLNQFQ